VVQRGVALGFSEHVAKGKTRRGHRVGSCGRTVHRSRLGTGVRTDAQRRRRPERSLMAGHCSKHREDLLVPVALPEAQRIQGSLRPAHPRG
jgi:hypothetical protein